MWIFPSTTFNKYESFIIVANSFQSIDWILIQILNAKRQQKKKWNDDDNNNNNNNNNEDDDDDNDGLM